MNRFGAPTTYKRIVPDRGCGFILKRIYELTEAPGLLPRPWPRKIDVYRNTRWYNRLGFASLLWSSLIKDGLIESDGGMQEYKYCKYCCYSFRRCFEVKTRAAGRYERGRGYTVRYHLTSKGRGVLFDMMDRVNAKNKTQPKLNTVGSVAKFDEEKDVRELPHSVKVNKGCEYDFLKNMTRTDLICEYRNVAMEADHLDAQLLAHEFDIENVFASNTINAAYSNICAYRDALAKEIERREKNETHDILKKEAVDCAKLASDYASENQKLRAEKDDLKERLKKVTARLEWLEHEIAVAKAVLVEIIG